jgi:hypothetical protein
MRRRVVIENTALRAIVAGAVGVAVWWLLNLLLVNSRLMLWYFVWAAFLVAVAIAVWAFIGLRRPARRPSA